MGRTPTINTDYFFVNKLVPVLEFMKTIRSVGKINFISQSFLINPNASLSDYTNDELLECFISNRHALQNIFVALSNTKSWLIKPSFHYRSMHEDVFNKLTNKVELIKKQITAVYSLVDTLIQSLETINKYLISKNSPFQEKQCIELFNVGFLPLLRLYGLPLATFDHNQYMNTDQHVGCHLDYHYVSQQTVLELINDFFKLNESLTKKPIFDHQGLISKIPRLYSYWGRALLFCTHNYELASSSIKTFENDNYVKLLYRNSKTDLIHNLDKNEFILPQLRNTLSSTEVAHTFNLNQAVEFLNSSFCYEKPFSERYVLNSRDLNSKRNFIFELGYGLLLETAHVESIRSHIERNPLDGYLATDTLVSFYCHFGIAPIDSGFNSKRNVDGYGKPSQIKSELIHLFLNHLYVYLPKRLDTYQLTLNERNGLLANKTEKSDLITEAYFQCNLKYQLKILPNVLHLYRDFKPDHFGLPVDIEVDERLLQYA